MGNRGLQVHRDTVLQELRLCAQPTHADKHMSKCRPAFLDGEVTLRNAENSLGFPAGRISRARCPPSKALRLQPLELESMIPFSLLTSFFFHLFLFFVSACACVCVCVCACVCACVCGVCVLFLCFVSLPYFKTGTSSKKECDFFVLWQNWNKSPAPKQGRGLWES